MKVDDTYWVKLQWELKVVACCCQQMTVTGVTAKVRSHGAMLQGLLVLECRGERWECSDGYWCKRCQIKLSAMYPRSCHAVWRGQASQCQYKFKIGWNLKAFIKNVSPTLVEEDPLVPVLFLLPYGIKAPKIKLCIFLHQVQSLSFLSLWLCCGHY